MQLSWPIPFGIKKNKLACMGYFYKGSMQRHPLFQGSIFSSWRLHARIISETSHQVSLSLDLWQACHNLNFIKTHQPNVVEIILHIGLTAPTPHIASRSYRNIQLSYFGVSSLSMSCVAFLALFVFRLVWTLSSWFQWVLAIIFIHTSLYYHCVSFH